LAVISAEVGPSFNRVAKLSTIVSGTYHNFAESVIGAASQRHEQRRFPMAKRNEKRPPSVIRPGQIITDSGIYIDRETGEKATLVKGKTAPPTAPGSRWREIISTHDD
jgi:hypothetical protein